MRRFAARLSPAPGTNRITTLTDKQ
jgi:hypothetical protein